MRYKVAHTTGIFMGVFPIVWVIIKGFYELYKWVLATRWLTLITPSTIHVIELMIGIGIYVAVAYGLVRYGITEGKWKE